MNTSLCIEIRQDQFGWHLESERTTCVSKKRCLAVGRMILMVSLAFFVEINGIIEGKPPKLFLLCLGGVCMTISANFRCMVWDTFWGEHP